MHEALMANPYETNIVAEALDRALSMDLDERKMRMNQLKKGPSINYVVKILPIFDPPSRRQV